MKYKERRCRYVPSNDDVYRTDFRSFPIFDLNRQISGDFGCYLCERCVQVDHDRSPVINLYDRVKEEHFLLTDDAPVAPLLSISIITFIERYSWCARVNE